MNWLRKTFGPRGGRKEIQQVIDESEQRGLIDEEEGEMIEGIFDLKQTVVREIMVPRTHVVALPKDSSLDQVLTAIIESGYSRIPVYDENVDQIVGVLNAKDLLPLWLERRDQIDLAAICREPVFVHETKRVRDLLGELRAKNTHIAVVVDEYGGTSGLVTIEDIIEEIIGEIRDEYDTEEELFAPQEDGSVLVRARVSLNEFEEYFSVTLPREGYDTLGGFVIHLVGKVPEKGEELSHQGLRLVIHSGDKKRITRVLVSRESEHDGSDPAVQHPGQT
ncbi:MAG: hemolysin family protein [Thermodesulfobacteriota bacterium]